MAAVTICSDYGAQAKKSVTVSIVTPSICHEVMGLDAMILVFWMLSFKPIFPLSSFTFIKRLFSSSLLSAIRVVSSAYLRLLIFLLGVGGSLVAQRLKRLPAMRETWIRSLGWEDPLEKEMATHYSILAWRIPWTEEPGGLQSTGLQRVGHDWAISLHITSLHFTYRRVLC